MRELNNFLFKEGAKTISATIETSEIFGEIQASLSRRREMMPLNDIWIAAHTIETGSELIPFDLHFRQIAGLRVWDELPASHS